MVVTPVALAGTCLLWKGLGTEEAETCGEREKGQRERAREAAFTIRAAISYKKNMAETEDLQGYLRG